MALTRKTDTTWKAYIPKASLYGYIILSALFILWTLFSMLKVGVYQVGYNNGVNNTALNIAAESVTQNACQSGITLPTADGKTTVLINVACLQTPPAPGETPVPSEAK